MTLYWDPATGRRHRDNSSCVLLYRDDNSRHVFIHDILYLTVSDDEQFSLSRQCDMVLDFMSARGLRRITIETNGLGLDCLKSCVIVPRHAAQMPNTKLLPVRPVKSWLIQPPIPYMFTMGKCPVARHLQNKMKFQPTYKLQILQCHQINILTWPLVQQKQNIPHSQMEIL